ncbi:MAG TPA: hypothetical protein VFX20_18250 [Steroidobacteraceae bacterium]|nr:hypothetical protein [Steroidobacteraceae bacterium]
MISVQRNQYGWCLGADVQAFRAQAVSLASIHRLLQLWGRAAANEDRW